MISISSVIGIVLALLGYGVALAVQTRFGLPHPMTFSSSLELFNLGCWAVVQILASSTNVSVIWDAIGELWASTWPMTVAVIVLAMVSALALWLTITIGKKSKHWLSMVISSPVSGDGMAGFLARHPHLTKMAVALAGSLGLLIGTPLLMTLGLMALVVLCAALALIPSVGLTVGKTYLDDWVIRPNVCVRVLNREALIENKTAKRAQTGSPKIYAANCVAIVRSNEEVDRGRVIFATPSAVVLFNPSTGEVRRVSIDGATIKVIGEL